MPSTWFPKTSEEVTAVPSPPPAPPQQQTCCALPWPYPQPTESLASRRERIATAILAGGVAHPESAGGVDCVKWAINLADMLIEELDKEGGR